MLWGTRDVITRHNDQNSKFSSILGIKLRDNDFDLEVDSIVQGDDEPAGHNDRRDSQLPSSISAVHPVQLHSHD